MITVHHLNNSRSQRILWLLEELGLDYKVRRYERDAKTLLAPPELRAIHPLGKSPVISDEGPSDPLTLAETGTIVEYLIERYGRKEPEEARLAPPLGTPERLRYTYWLHYAEGSLMPPLLLGLVFSRLPQGPMPFFVRPIARRIAGKVQSSYIGPQIAHHLDYVESELGRSPWFAGAQFSAADIQMSFPIEAVATRIGLGDRHPHLEAYLERIHARPAYARALERGGRYDFGR